MEYQRYFPWSQHGLLIRQVPCFGDIPFPHIAIDRVNVATDVYRASICL